MSGNKSAVLGIIGIILGAGGLGYSILTTLNLQTQIQPAENQWYDSTSSVNYMAASENWNDLSSISIDFYVGLGQKVYFSYIAEIDFDSTSTPSSYVQINLKVNGIRWAIPKILVSRDNIVSPHGLRMSVSLQHYNTTMPAGTHTVTLTYKGDDTSDSIRPCSLFVQTFN